MKAESLSPDENPPKLLVSSSDVACTNAYLGSTADSYFFSTPAICVANVCNCHVLEDSSMFEYGCLTSKTIFIGFALFYNDQRNQTDRFINRFFMRIWDILF